MLSIKNLEVKLFNIDISPIITSMVINESVHGDLSGTISIHDGVNLVDNVINKQSVVNITYEYLDLPTEVSFYVNGVTDISISKSSKIYNIHLESINKLISSNNVLSETYTGSSSKILSNIYSTLYGKDSLKVISKTLTSGKYIAPNISSRKVIDIITQNAYDSNYSGMFLYQRLLDGGITRLESHHDILQNIFAGGFKIKEKVASISDSNSLGTSSNFFVKEDNNDILNKMQVGAYGLSADVLDISETSSTTFSNGTSISMLGVSRKDLYDTDTPLLRTSLFSTHKKSTFAKFRMFNVNMIVSDVVSIPGISCGYVIGIEQGGGDVSGSSYDGGYLVSGITHKMRLDGGEMFYSQDYSLVRES